MIKLNIDNFRSELSDNKYNYILKRNSNKITIKRINKTNNKFIEEIILNLDTLEVDINIIPEYNLTYSSFDVILNDMKGILKNNVIIQDLINIEELFKYIILNYKKILLSDGTIGLTNHFIKLDDSKYFMYDIVLLDTNEIIGEIRGSSLKDFKIYVKTLYLIYYEEAIELFKKTQSSKLKKLVN